jgi:hypothetical protein
MQQFYAPLGLLLLGFLAVLLLIAKDNGWRFSLRLLIFVMTVTALLLAFFMASNSEY